jgi:hypothetical protein
MDGLLIIIVIEHHAKLGKVWCAGSSFPCACCTGRTFFAVQDIFIVLKTAYKL